MLSSESADSLLDDAPLGVVARGLDAVGACSRHGASKGPPAVIYFRAVC